MDMQGTPIGNTATGTKNTSTPADPIQEGPGAIAKDSLAAESSAFSDDQTSSVEGSKSTLNNTDTSGATTLEPAPDAEARAAGEEGQASDDIKGAGGLKYAEAVGGQGDFEGTHSDQGYAGGPTSESAGDSSYKTGLGSGGDTTSGGSRGGASSNADAAPSYATDLHTSEQKPKGNNITEGGFDTDAPNASFTTGIDDKDDPGREAQAQMLRQSAGDAADAGMPNRQQELDTNQPYDALNSEENA